MTNLAYEATNSDVEKLIALIKASREEDSIPILLGHQFDHLIAALEQAQKRNAELEVGVKFPGVMRCPKCDFSRTHINVTPTGMYAAESAPENCPNGCGPMWHGTYKREYNELYDHKEQLSNELAEMKRKCAELQEQKDKWAAWAIALGAKADELESRPLCVKSNDAMREAATLCVKLPDSNSKAFWSGVGKTEKFHPETYKRWVKEAIERAGVIAGIKVEVK